MDDTSIRVAKETKRKLVRIKGKMESKTGKTTSFDEGN